MSESHENKVSSGLIKGDFFTDGRSYVFRLTGTPLSGIGATPSEAFDDLMRVNAACGGLAQKLEELAREQHGETVRAAVVRMTMIGLIAFGVTGGALVGAAALAPRVVGDITEIFTHRLGHWLDTMSPTQREGLARLTQDATEAVAEGCEAPASPDSPPE